MFAYKKRALPISVRHQMERLTAENAALKEQVQEQADALVELAALLTEEEADEDG